MFRLDVRVGEDEDDTSQFMPVSGRPDTPGLFTSLRGDGWATDVNSHDESRVMSVSDFEKSELDGDTTNSFQELDTTGIESTIDETVEVDEEDTADLHAEDNTTVTTGDTATHPLVPTTPVHPVLHPSRPSIAEKDNGTSYPETQGLHVALGNPGDANPEIGPQSTMGLAQRSDADIHLDWLCRNIRRQKKAKRKIEVVSLSEVTSRYTQLLTV